MIIILIKITTPVNPLLNIFLASITYYFYWPYTIFGRTVLKLL